MHEPFAQKESNLQKKHKLPLTMASPSVPLRVDPANWNRQRSHQLGGGGGGGGGGGYEAHNLPPPQQLGMADRARLANMAHPDQALKCPRCDSTNTKFCYFNNYSLSQPRHFCKACRRYWTRGGALRNVPVGGGCRRNKRHKSGTGGRSRSTAEKPTTGAATNYQCIDAATNSSAIASAAGSLHPFIHGNLGMRTLDAVELENLGFHHHVPQFPKISGVVGPRPPLPSLPLPNPNLFSSFGEGIGVEGPSFGAKMEGYGQDLSLETQYYLADPKYDLFWGGSS